MNAKELAAVIADRNGISKKQAGDILDSVGDIITGALSSGQEVNLPGLGKIMVKRTNERQGRNPATGEEITVPAKNLAKFKASKALSDRLN